MTVPSALHRIAAITPVRAAAATVAVALLALGGSVLSGVAGPFAPLALLVLAGALLLSWRAPSWALAAGLSLAPFEGLQVPVAGIGGLSPTEGALVLVAVGWVLRAFTGSGRTVWPRAADAPVLALIVLVAPGLALGAERVVVVKVMVMWTAFYLSYLTARSLTRPERQRVVLALGLGAAILGLTGLQAYLAGGGAVLASSGAYGRASSGIPDPNYYAGYLQLAAVPVLAIGIARRGAVRAFALVASACCTLGIVLSLSRGATLGLVLGASLVVMAWSRSRRATLVGAGVLVVLGAINLDPLLSTPLAQTVGARLSSSGDLGGNGDRLSLWRFALRLIVEHPFGIGFDRFGDYAAQSGLTVRTEPFQQAHNVYLNLAVELGVLGLVAFLAWVAVILRDVQRVARQGAAHPDFALAIGIGAAFAGYLFQALTVTLYQVQIIQATFFVLAGLAAGLTQPERRPDAEIDAGKAEGRVASSESAAASGTARLKDGSSSAAGRSNDAAW